MFDGYWSKRDSRNWRRVLTLEEALSQLTGDDIMIGFGLMFMIYGLVILNQEDE